jgi:hypothetical protein
VNKAIAWLKAAGRDHTPLLLEAMQSLATHREAFWEGRRFKSEETTLSTADKVDLNDYYSEYNFECRHTLPDISVANKAQVGLSVALTIAARQLDSARKDVARVQKVLIAEEQKKHGMSTLPSIPTPGSLLIGAVGEVTQGALSTGAAIADVEASAAMGDGKGAIRKAAAFGAGAAEKFPLVAWRAELEKLVYGENADMFPGNVGARTQKLFKMMGDSWDPVNAERGRVAEPFLEVVIDVVSMGATVAERKATEAALRAAMKRGEREFAIEFDKAIMRRAERELATEVEKIGKNVLPKAVSGASVFEEAELSNRILAFRQLGTPEALAEAEKLAEALKATKIKALREIQTPESLAEAAALKKGIRDVTIPSNVIANDAK